MTPTLCRGALIFSIRTMSTCACQLGCLLSGGMEKYLICDTIFLILSADNVSGEDDFLINLKISYSSCSSYFFDEKTRWKCHGIIKSYDGLYTYHDRLDIPHPAQDMRILLLTEYHDNVGHPNWRRLLLKRFWWERMSFDCKAHCSNYVVFNRAKPSRHDSSSLSLLGVPN